MSKFYQQKLSQLLNVIYDFFKKKIFFVFNEKNKINQDIVNDDTNANTNFNISNNVSNEIKNEINDKSYIYDKDLQNITDNKDFANIQDIKYIQNTNMQDDLYNTNTIKRDNFAKFNFKKIFYFTLFIIFIILILIIIYIYKVLSYNVVLKEDINIKIVAGNNTIDISKVLKSSGLIEDARVFRLLSYLYNTENKLKTGVYTFEKNKTYNMWNIYDKISNGKSDKPLIVLIIPEGWTNIKIANRLELLLDNFDKQKFLNLASEYEGYLFPETYYIDDSFSEEKIIKLMKDQFNKRVSNFNNSQIVLASIIEGEAKHFKDMKIISGILQTRMQKGMRLQVDVAMETYKKSGLPNSPINNPGTNALDAVKNPIYTEYLYYITGNDGNMYYAKTFDEHRKNIQKYLK